MNAPTIGLIIDLILNDAPEPSAATPEQLVRATLQPTLRLTDEQALELTEDITVVMAVERLTPLGAWRLIVERVDASHDLPRYLTALTSRHRAKQPPPGGGTQRRFAARLYVGPDSDSVREIARRMRQAGIAITLEDAGHIHYTIQAPSPEAVPPHTIAALRAAFPPSDTSGYSWSWVADRVFDVHPDDSVSLEYHPPLRWYAL